MRRALLECSLLGVSGGLLGCWLVLYGLSYSTESFAHAMLPGLVTAALLAALAGALLVAVQGLGNLLVVAILVAPAATARLVTHRLPAMMALSVAVALAGCLAGLYLSYYASTAAGASIAGALVAVFALVRAGYDLA